MVINSREIKERVKETGFHSNFMKFIESIKGVKSTTHYTKTVDKKRESVSFDLEYIPIIVDIYDCYEKKGKESLIGKIDDELLYSNSFSSYMCSFRKAIPILKKIYNEYGDDKKNSYKYGVRDIIRNISNNDDSLYTNFKSTLIYSDIDIIIINEGISKEEDVRFNDMDALIKFLVNFEKMNRNEKIEYAKKMKQANSENDNTKVGYINRTIIHVLPILLEYKTEKYNSGEQLEFKVNNRLIDEISNKICSMFAGLEVVKVNDRLIIDGEILLTLDEKDKKLKAYKKYDIILITNDFNCEDIFKKIIDRCFSYNGN